MTAGPGEAGSRRAERLLALAILLTCWLAYFYPVIGRGEIYMPYRYLEDPGIGGEPTGARLARRLMRLPNNDYALMLVHYPAFQFEAEGYRSGGVPLWNPCVGCGTPVDSDPQYKPFNPFMVPFYLLPSTWTFWVGLALEALVGMVGFFSFFRKMGLPAALSSVWAAFSVFNPWTQQMMMLSNVWADWLLGWALLASWWAARGGPLRATLPAAACALFLACGHPEEALMLTGVVLVAFLVLIFGKSGSIRAVALRASVFAVTLAGLTAVYTLPFLCGRPLLASYKELWSGIGGYPVGALFCPDQIVWVPPLLWGLVAVALFRGVSGRMGALCLAGLGALVAFRWPHLDALRGILALNHTLVAIYAQTLFWLGLLWLSVQGCKALIEAPKETRARLARALVYGFALYYALSWAYASAQSEIFWPDVYVGVHRILLAAGVLSLAALYSGRLKPVMLTAAVALLLLVSPLLPMAPYRFLTSRNPADDPPPAVRFLQDHVGPHERFNGLLCSRPGGRKSDYPLLAPNQANVWALRDIRLSGPFWLSGYAQLNRRWTALNEGFTVSTFTQADARFLSWLGVSFVAAPHGELPQSGFSLAYSSTSMDVWKIEGAATRARMVFDWVRCDDADESARLSRSLFSVASPPPVVPVAGIVASGPRPGTEPVWAVRWLEDSPERVSLAVRTSRGGLLFLADSYHPGWRAQVDGRPSPIYKAMGAFRAVPVPAGEHTITFRYISGAFRAGAAFSLFTLIGLVMLASGGLTVKRLRRGKGPRTRVA